jgi:hypothetical protein
MRLVDALRRVLRNGPMTDAALMTALDQLGQRHAEPGEIWQACREHGIADLVDDQWVPRGWAAPAATTEPSGREARSEFRVRLVILTGWVPWPGGGSRSCAPRSD